MRIRCVKPEFFKHECLFDLERETGFPIRIAFEGLWCAADREGRFKWRPRSLKTEIVPYDDCDFSRVLDALMTRGFIRHYSVNGEEYGLIPSFKDHQHVNPREAPSQIPEPIEFTDASSTREARVDHRARGAGRKGREGKGTGKEGNSTPKPPLGARSETQQTDDFERFWEIYPRKVGKGATRMSWKKLKPTQELVEQILASVQKHKTCEQWIKENGRFVPMPSTWLNQTRWEDEPDSAEPLGVNAQCAKDFAESAEVRKYTPGTPENDAYCRDIGIIPMEFPEIPKTERTSR